MKRPEFWVEQKSDPCDARCQSLEKTEPLFSERKLKPGEARDIAARPRKACNKALADRIADSHEHDRYGVSHLPQCDDARRSDGKYHLWRCADKLRRVGLDACGVGASRAIVDLQVAALAPALFLHRLPECRHASYHFRIVCGKAAEHADPPHAVALLRARREWPCGRRRAEQRDELAPLHAGHRDFLPCRVASAPPGSPPAGDDARLTAPSSCRTTGGKSLGQT